MIRNTFTQSGELAIISGVKFFVPKFIKSLQVRVTVILSVFVILSSVILMNAILQSYDQRTVSVRTAEIQNQCTILSNQLVNSDYLKTGVSDVIDTELSQLSNIYNGRVLLIDQAYYILKDTYDMDEGKRIVSGDVTGCMSGKGTTFYDSKNRYIEVTSPIMDAAKEKVIGVMLVSVSTDSIAESKGVLGGKANVVAVVAVIIALVLAIGLGFLMVRPFQRITRRIEAVTEGYHADYLHENAYTETKILSEAFNKMLGRLKAQDDSRQEFVSNVSHELKTPLTSMKVLADSLLIQENVPTELYREFMGDLSEEIERENKIINDLLDLVKLDKKGANLNIKSQDVNELVERILKRLQPLAAKSNIELVFESFRPVTAEIDEVKIALVITNLVENAIKYSFRGCKGEHRLTIEAVKAEEQLHLIIVNNGQCIEKVRLKELNEGTKIKNHLGISNVRKRLELYYGEDTAVYFENILSGGVKVHLFIPIQGGNDDADSSH